MPIAVSRDRLFIPIDTPVDYSSADVDVSVSPSSTDPTALWAEAHHVAGGVEVAYGPGTAIGPLSWATHWVHVRVSGLDGILPIFCVGPFVIEGGLEPAPVPSGLSFDVDGVPYFDPLAGGGGQLLADIDGVPYVEA